MSFPLIANKANSEFLVIKKIEDGHATVSDEKWHNKKLSLNELSAIYGGVALSAQSAFLEHAAQTKQTGSSIFKNSVFKLGIILLLLTALIISSGFLYPITWQRDLFMGFKTLGVITSILLLVQSIDSNNPLIQRLCGGGRKTNCNAVLSSKAANIFEGLSWSEVGFFYFAGTWLLALFGGGSALTWKTLAVLNLLSLPYTFYSIYYQAIIAKQWCLLCCTVQVLLWLEFFTLSPISQQADNVTLFLFNDFRGLATTIFCLSFPVVLWLFVKPYLLQLQQMPALKGQVRKFKYNTELFKIMLSNQPRYVTPEKDWSIVLGNAEAGNVITMVSNPYCAPCGKMHNALDQLLSENDNLQARVVFTVSNTDEDIRTPVARHLMALNNLADKVLVKCALHDWYNQKQSNYEEWAKIYPAELKDTEFYKLDQQKEWCTLAAVTATPTMLLNGYRLPEIYQLTDLTYMLE